MAEISTELPDLIAARLVPLLDQRIDVIMSKFDSLTEILLNQEQKIRELAVRQDGEEGMCDMPPRETPATASPARFENRVVQDVGDHGQNTPENGTVSNIKGRQHSFNSHTTPMGLDGPNHSSRRTHSWRVGIDDEGRPHIVKTEAQREIDGPSRFVHWLVWHPRFDAFWLSVITLNAVFMGVQLEIYVRSGHDHWSNHVGDAIFIALFCIELLLRLGREGISNYFCGKSRSWAVLDVFILSLSFVELILYIYESTNSATPLRVVRVFRVLRIAKVLRGIRFMRDLRLLIVGMLHSVRSITWTVLALIFIMYTGAVIIMSLVVDDVREGETYYVQCWGDIATSMCTLFQVMSGDGWWSEVVVGIDSNYPGIRYFFMAYYSITAYGLLNIVTGIFVEQTFTASRTDFELLHDKRLEERKSLEAFFENLFDVMDANNTGEVDFDEFVDCIKEPDIRFAMELAGIKVDESVKVFQLLDSSVDGTISCKEFVKGCMLLRGQPTTGDILVSTARTSRAIRRVEDGLGGQRGRDSYEITI